MPKIDWLLACDLAYFDRLTRLCVVGVTTHLFVPSLPVQRREMMLVADVRDLTPADPLPTGVAVPTPAGRWIGPSQSDGLHVEVTGEYILATLRDVPFTDEGLYRFAMYIDPETPATLELPVIVSAGTSAAV